MEKENNVVYVKTKNGIYKCYKSETEIYLDEDEVFKLLKILEGKEV